MEKIKIIDLLNKIANREEIPKYINYIHRAFGKDTMMVCKENIINKLDTGVIELNDEVEIIEEDKKIEPINKIYDLTDFHKEYPKVAEMMKEIGEKQREIIDYINKENK